VGIGRDLWTEMEALHNQQNVAGIPDLYTSDAVFIMPDGRCDGPAAIKGYLDASAAEFSDFEAGTLLLIESGDHVVAEWVLKSTHKGGQRVELQGVTVATVRDGKFATYRDYFDPADLARQVGAVPTG
jgi:ketosteroid isomerase-like protein